MLFESGQMFGRALALVRRQIILRIDRIPAANHRVALNFRNDRRRGNRDGKRIAVNDAGLRTVNIKVHSVDQQIVRRGRKLGDCVFMANNEAQ